MYTNNGLTKTVYFGIHALVCILNQKVYCIHYLSTCNKMKFVICEYIHKFGLGLNIWETADKHNKYQYRNNKVYEIACFV